MNFSFIVIGRNSEKTLGNCLQSIRNAVNNCHEIGKHQIVYIDSASSDNSVVVAQSAGVEVAKITEGFTSAALGRYIGKTHSKYENLVFVDSDMYIDSEWFNKSLPYYIEYQAIIGERHEKLIKNDIVFKEIENFYKIDNIEPAKNIGGFLMISAGIIENINFTPILKNEEEKDFYAKFYKNNKIHRIPYKAYIHNNYNLSASRLKDYMNPLTKNGYILSFINSMNHGYLDSFMKLQTKYIVSVFTSVFFYLSLTGNKWFIILSILTILINGVKNLKGTLMTALFFPYKLIGSIILCTKVYKTKYNYMGNEFEITIKI